MKAYIFLLMIFLTSCSHLQTRKQIKDEQVKKAPQTTTAEEENTKLSGLQEEPVSEPVIPKVGLILGPGGVKTFAHTGVIKELLKAKININKIIGLEWGALVAALYAQNSQVHEAEWKMYKLSAKDLPDKELFSNRYSPITISSFTKFLRKNLTIEAAQAKVDFSCPSMSYLSGATVWQEYGKLSQAVARCLPYPPIFKPEKYIWMASAFAIKDSIKKMREAGMDVIIYVDVLGSGQIMATKDLEGDYQSAIIWHELRRHADQYSFESVERLRVKTDAFKLFDFANRSQLLSAGKSAGRQLGDRFVETSNF
mgnify:CR=1 FL=1